VPTSQQRERDEFTAAHWNGHVRIAIYSSARHLPAVPALSREFFGREIAPLEWAELVGAPDSAEVFVPAHARRVYSAEGDCPVSSNRIGPHDKWPRIPNFDTTGVPPGGDQSIILSEEDERLLDEIWAEVRRRPAKVFGGTLPPIPEGGGDALESAGGASAATSSDRGDARNASSNRNGTSSSAAGAAKRRRKAAPTTG
jgi:hypothetical protein